MTRIASKKRIVFTITIFKVQISTKRLRKVNTNQFCGHTRMSFFYLFCSKIHHDHILCMWVGLKVNQILISQFWSNVWWNRNGRKRDRERAYISINISVVIWWANLPFCHRTKNALLNLLPKRRWKKKPTRNRTRYVNDDNVFFSLQFHILNQKENTMQWIMNFVILFDFGNAVQAFRLLYWCWENMIS